MHLNLLKGNAVESPEIERLLSSLSRQNLTQHVRKYSSMAKIVQFNMGVDADQYLEFYDVSIHGSCAYP
jgi:hypothetical protein